MVDEAEAFVRRTRRRRAIQLALVGALVLAAGLYVFSPGDWADFFAGTAVVPRKVMKRLTVGAGCAAIGFILLVVSGVLFARIGRQLPVETDEDGHELIPRARVERDNRDTRS